MESAIDTLKDFNENLWSGDQEAAAFHGSVILVEGIKLGTPARAK